MEVVVMLRELWRRRWLVLLSGLLAVAIGVLMAYRVHLPFKFESRAYTVGVATTTAMLDTPSSQVVDLGDANDSVAASAGSLPGRAALLASVLTISPLKEQIAKTAGIDPRTLIAGTPAPGSALPVPSIGSISAKSRNASLLTATTFDGLPILGVNVTAPDEQTAARLSSAAIKVLIAHVNTIGNADGVPSNRRLVIKQLGEPRSATAKHGPSRKLAAVAVVFIFGLLCAAILTVSWIRTRWKVADAWDRMPPIDWDSLSPEQFETPVQDAPAHAENQEPEPPPPPPGDRWDTVR